MKPVHQVIVDSLSESLIEVSTAELNGAARGVIETLRREGYEIERRRGA